MQYQTNPEANTMKKFILAAATPPSAVPAAASASVNVDDSGAGFVGKGDVQDALSLKNDAAMQELFKKDGIKFTTTFKTKKDTSWTCTDGTVKHHYFNTTSTNQLNAAAPAPNGAGKLSNGWILDGGISVYGPTTGFTTGDDGTGRFATYSCLGHGSTIFSTMNVEDQIAHEVGGLQVNGIDLPNTPVEVAPIA